MAAITPAPVQFSNQAWEFEKPVCGGIVAAVDGSHDSIAALNTAAAIARSRRCALHVVSVLPPFPSYKIGPESPHRDDNVAELRLVVRDSELAEIVRALEPEPGWTREVVTGRPARELVCIAERRGAEMLVMGRGHHGAMDRLLGGETTLQVMRMSSVPVMAVESEIGRPHTIVVAIDFSPSSARAARIALQLLRATGSGSLYLVFVEPPAQLIAHEFREPSESRFPGDVVVWFRRLIDSLGAHPGILTEPVVLTGGAASSVLEFAGRVGADMIAAGSHSHGRFERFLLGSVSTSLVRSASCPVLLVPPGS
jgi:nucleotide-binding universal stress UspA family protein